MGKYALKASAGALCPKITTFRSIKVTLDTNYDLAENLYESHKKKELKEGILGLKRFFFFPESKAIFDSKC